MFLRQLTLLVALTTITSHYALNGMSPEHLMQRTATGEALRVILLQQLTGFTEHLNDLVEKKILSADQAKTLEKRLIDELISAPDQLTRDAIEKRFYTSLLKVVRDTPSPVKETTPPQKIEFLDSARRGSASPTRSDMSPSPLAISPIVRSGYHATTHRGSPPPTHSVVSPMAVYYGHPSYGTRVMMSPVEIFTCDISELCSQKIISHDMYLHFRKAVDYMSGDTLLEVLRGELAQTLEQIRSQPAILHDARIHFDYCVGLYKYHYPDLAPYLEAINGAIFLCPAALLNALKSMFYETLSYYLKTGSIYTNPELPKLLAKINAHAAVPHKTAPASIRK
jgi:hypothetical protein